MADLSAWLPVASGLLSGPAGAGLAIAWWKHTERKREQTDNVALSLVDQLRHRIDVLENWVKDLQQRLGSAEAEKLGLLWLLKYCPEDQRAAAVADAERQMRDAKEAAAMTSGAALAGDLRQAAQVVKSAAHLVADKDQPRATETPGP